MSENDEADAGLTQAFPILSWDAQVRRSLGIAYINTLPPPVTGDQRPTLPRREKLGIAEVEDLPDQKSVVVTRLHKARRIVAMAEHGVNDATALVAADVGVAMGTGMNDAMESVGVTLLRAISAASSALPVSRGQRCATSVRTCSLRLSITQQESNRGGCALPDISLLLSQIIAAAAMALSSVTVVGNALRLRVAKL